MLYLISGLHSGGFLLGDSAYASKKYMLTPFINPVEPWEKKYNLAHARTRVTIEQTFGILKRRFGILQKTMNLKPLKACKATVSCVVLHVIGIDTGDIILLEPDIDDVFDPTQHVDLNAVDLEDEENCFVWRNKIARSFFGP